ncbi:MAG: DUF359 domain-containing protein [Archaeoglobales archaeon]|nr:DUF359 domain-containing protein [Archaeoglobales archaeon]
MLKLPDYLRSKLAKPQGKLYKDGERVYERIEEIKTSKMIACVGDLVTIQATKFGVDVNIAVIDGKTLREKSLDFDIRFFEILEVENPAGVITCKLLNVLKIAVRDALSGKKVCVRVDGEEDLAALPLALLLPENSVILYGQPKEGVVAVKIDSSSKKRFREILRQMEKIGDCGDLDELLGGE